jgi:putative endopeptidase
MTAPRFHLIAATLAALCTAPALAADACIDFDSHVNGRWNASTEIPAHRARIGSFDTLRMANDKLLESALAELAQQPSLQTSPGLKLLAAYYRSGMDEAAIERAGLSAAAPWLARIDAVTRETLPGLLADMARLQAAAPLALFVGTDAKDARRHLLQLGAAGLGLPDREDYFRSDARSAALKTAYRSHAAVLLKAAGAPADDVVLDSLMAFETQLAQATMTNVQRRDPRAVYNPHTPASLQALAPGLDWKALLAGYTGRPEGVAGLNVSQPAFVQAVATLAAQAPLDHWRPYLRVRLLAAVAPQGPKLLADSHFAYDGAAVRGLKAPAPRIENVILHIGGRTGGSPLGQTLGELFVSKSFSPLAQARAEAMLADIKEGMRRRVLASPWMTKPTQVKALEKLDAMAAKIGRPANWRRYAGLALKPDDYLGNLLRVNAWASADRLPDLDRPVDRERWNTSPHIVNAFAAGGNQIVFPAGILQPPFFDAQADDASNYGAIGMVIGHEITHHFDDRGRQFDSVGNLNDWWTAEDAAAYRARADRVVALYERYEPLPGQRINGRLTLGENLSDVGGIQIAFEGLKVALERQRQAGKPAPAIDGATPEQRFFMANALVWRGKYRSEAMINQLRTDSHSPGRWRVLAPMSNMTAFAAAFGCRAGDPMVAADPIVVW